MPGVDDDDEGRREARAAEYVLGTSSADERIAFEADLARDPGLMRAVRAWEDRLSPLAEGLPPVRPSDDLWPAVRAATLRAAPERREGSALAPPDGDRLRRSLARWRVAALGGFGLAASLAIALAFPLLTRPAPRTLMAVVNQTGDLPALIVRVDTADGTVQVRPVETSAAPAGHSLELWAIVGTGQPRSLGLVPGRAASRAFPNAPRREALANSTVAVSVEPQGGSPTGLPTGPIVYRGRLIAEE